MGTSLPYIHLACRPALLQTHGRRLHSSEGCFGEQLEVSQSIDTSALLCYRQEADDTEELQKAALEKLKAHPHGSRMAVLPLGSKKIDMELIDVRRLNKQARQNVLRRAMEVDDQDNEKLLSKIKQRQDR